MNYWKNKRVLVTGGAGFIGRHLVKNLVYRGAFVQVIDNLWRGNLENLKDEDGKFVIDIKKNFIHADLTEPKKTRALIKNFDIVYHLADVVAGVDYVFNNELFVYRQNMLININTLSACLINEIPNYIYVGTACSYPKHLQMAEGIAALSEDQTFPAEPESSYGWSKLMGEYEADLSQKSGKINVGLIRFHNVYGPICVFDEIRSQVIPALIRKAVRFPKEPFIVWGSGNQYRDFIYVTDAVSSLLLVAEKGMNQGLIQIGSEKATSVKELSEKIVKISGKAIPIKSDKTKPEGDRGRIAVCDRARRILNWKPEVEIDEGLEKTYSWIEKQIKSNRRVSRG